MKKLVLVLMVLTSLNVIADDATPTVITPLRYTCPYKASNGKSGIIIIDLKKEGTENSFSLYGAFFMTLPFVVTNLNTGVPYPADTLFGKPYRKTDIKYVEIDGYYGGDTVIGTCRHHECPRSTINEAFDLSWRHSNTTQGINFTIFSEETNQGKKKQKYEMYGDLDLYQFELGIAEIKSNRSEDSTKIVRIKSQGPCILQE